MQRYRSQTQSQTMIYIVILGAILAYFLGVNHGISVEACPVAAAESDEVVQVGRITAIRCEFVESLPAFPEAWGLGLREPIDDLNREVIRSRTADNPNPVFTYFFQPLSDSVDLTARKVEDALLWLPWPVLIAGFFLLGQKIKDLRLGLLAAGCLFFMGLFGLWDESMQTLALMFIAVAISLLIAIPFGIWSAQNDRVETFLRPFLDTMQTMPAFVYLIPVLLFFGVARAPGIIATVVYAVPPAVRMTNLGIRGVPEDAIEAARSFGSTERQVLYKVKLPMALPSIMLGVNQTIMMALGIVVIASLVGAGGLGREILLALRRVRVGQALEAGLAIVLLAVLLDRVSAAFAEVEHSSIRQFQGFRLFPETSRQYALAHMTEAGIDKLYRGGGAVTSQVMDLFSRKLSEDGKRIMKRYDYLLVSFLFLLLLTLVLKALSWNDFPETWDLSIREPVNDAVRWMQINLVESEPIDLSVVSFTLGTRPLSNFITLQMLNPLRSFLQVWLSWPVVVLIFTSLAFAVSGWRLALVSAGGLVIIGGLGMWTEAMDTLSQVIVAVILSILIGVPLGVWSARSDVAESIIRPLMDFLQTIPTFVYLVPVIMLFSLGRVPGIMASVLYSLPPAVRLTNLGLRQVDAQAIEAAQSFGSTYWQTLRKVRIPLAMPAIMMGINQTIMMVLAMVIIAGLVSGGGLGYQVVFGFSQQQIGLSLEAGIAIVILAVVLDRITQAWAQRQREAANISV